MSARDNERSVGMRALWRNRDYMLLWSGQAISQTGGRVSDLAFPLLILALTGSPAQAGLLGAAGTVPSLLLSLPAGALIDRWNRKRTMIACDIGRALLIGSVAVAFAFGWLSVPQLYLVAISQGVLGTFFGLAQSSALAQVVPPEQLAAAAAQNEALFPIGDFLGPPIGGVLFGISRAAPFAVDAVSYFASVIALLRVQSTFQTARSAAPRRLRTEVGEGLRWLWGNPVIRFLALLSSGAFFVDAGGPLAVIVIARERGASPALIGALSTVAAVGGLLGFAVIGFVQRRFSVRHTLIATVCGLVVVWPVLAVVPGILTLGVVLGWNYLCFSVFTSVEAGYRLARIPDALQGRVNSVFRLIAFGSYPLGAAATGVLLQTVGPRVTLFGYGGWMLLLAVTTISTRALRDTAPLQPEA